MASNKEVYAETTLTEGEWVEAKSAWHRLRSPSHWPSRLKTWFLQPQPTVIGRSEIREWTRPNEGSEQRRIF